MAARVSIQRLGERVRWLQALPCDCRDPADPTYGDARACTRCEHGYVYREQVLPANVRVLLTRQRREFLHPEVGLVRVGDLTVTAMPDEIQISDFDKLVLIDRAAPKKELVTRGSGERDALAEEYPLAVAVVADGDTVFVEGTDYLFDEEAGEVVWLAGGSVPGGRTYAVSYTFAPVYWYTGTMSAESRPMPGYSAPWPKSGLLQVHFPEV